VLFPTRAYIEGDILCPVCSNEEVDGEEAEVCSLPHLIFRCPHSSEARKVWHNIFDGFAVPYIYRAFVSRRLRGLPAQLNDPLEDLDVVRIMTGVINFEMEAKYISASIRLSIFNTLLTVVKSIRVQWASYSKLIQAAKAQEEEEGRA
jgi:hypothetical protein